MDTKPKPSSPRLHRLVTEAMAERKLSVKKLAELTGIPRRSLGGFLTEGRRIYWEDAKALSRALKFSLSVAAWGNERMRRSKRIAGGQS